MSHKSPVEKKSSIVPGYKGFVPGVRSGSMFGKSFTEESRAVMKPEILDKPGKLASTGFNMKL